MLIGFDRQKVRANIAIGQSRDEKHSTCALSIAIPTTKRKCRNSKHTNKVLVEEFNVPTSSTVCWEQLLPHVRRTIHGRRTIGSNSDQRERFESGIKSDVAKRNCVGLIESTSSVINSLRSSMTRSSTTSSMTTFRMIYLFIDDSRLCSFLLPFSYLIIILSWFVPKAHD